MKGFVTAGTPEFEGITFYGGSAWCGYEVSLHDILTTMLARHPGVPLTAMKVRVYQQREPQAMGCIVKACDERGYVGIKIVEE